MPPENQSQFNPQEPIPSPEKKPNTLLWVAVLVGIFLVGLAVVLFVLGERDRDPVVPEEENVEKEEVEELDTSDPALGEIEEWRTYRNEEYGFEFRYPVSFSLEIGTESFIHPDYRHDCFVAELSGGSETESIFEFRLNCSGVGLDPTTAEERPDSVDGREAIRIFPGGYVDGEFPDEQGKFLMVRYTEPDYNFVLWGRGIQDPEDEGLFNQILSTFRFLNEGNNISWQTYRNEEYGFEFRYPEEYIVEDRHMGDGPKILTGFSIRNIQNDSETSIIAVELAEGMSCYLGLCLVEAEETLLINGHEWENLGDPLYAAGTPFRYSIHFRAVVGDKRFYFLSHEEGDKDLLSTFRFLD